MAYAAAITTAIDGVNAIVTVSETEAATSSEASVQLPFLSGRILKVVSELTAGTGTSVRPVIGTSTDPASSAADTIVSIAAASAAAAINAVTDPPTPFTSSDGLLYHRARVDAGADNSITTTYFIQRGIA